MTQRAGMALVALALLLGACGGGGGTKSTPTPTIQPTTAAQATPTPAATPVLRIPNTSPSSNITLPAGFAAYPIATGFSNPTSIAIAPDGTLYVSESGGDVYALADGDGDGVFEQPRKFFSTTGAITGLMVGPDGTVFVSSTGKVTAVRGDATTDIITGLPHGRHQNNGLAIGPDGKLYITNGSTCDDCTESDLRSATIQQANPDGSGLRIYAHGLRNSYDITFDDQGRLWATDNGSDTPCATIDELDLIVDGGDYGWPYGSKGCDANTAGTPPVANLGLHTASTGVTFYNGNQFPSEYRGDLFATVWGSFFAAPDPYDRVLLRIRLQEPSASGQQPAGVVEQFASGFAHPIDVFADRDGTLLVLDYGSDDDGTLYRVVYTGG